MATESSTSLGSLTNVVKIVVTCLSRVAGKGGPDMPRKAPWHSVKQPVHHNNTNCNTGNNIERENLRQGTGNKPLCSECTRLNQQGR